MNCKKCGNIIVNNAKFCNVCGEKNDTIEFTNIMSQQLPANNINTNKKIDNKKIIIPIIIVVSIIVIFTIGFFAGKNIESQKCDKNVNGNFNEVINENTDNNDDDDILGNYTHKLFVPSKVEKEINNTELGKNVTINEIFFNSDNNSYSKYKKAFFYGKNSNTTPVSLKLILEYYDSEGYRIEKTSSFETPMLPGKEFVVEMTIEDDTLNYSRVKLSYEVNKIKSYQKNIDENKINVTSQLLSDGNISIILQNKSNEKISSNSLACLYYKDNKLVFAQDAYISSLEPNQISEGKCYGHTLNLNDDYQNLKKIEYDDYKVILYSAYTSDSTNY